ncbi:MAG: sodium:solute symporter, partial [Dehalococcoidia bacterium]|nr:sodium:solute symporter [Dehalococcoidia bacterium]
MNFELLDWVIVFGVLIFVVCLAIYSKMFMTSVADFLVANRCAGRYVMATCEGVASAGAIAFVAAWEMYYEAGFTPLWWQFMTLPTSMIITLSGYVIYRYRQTRAMTVAQFFEIRYSKNFRIFAGFLCFLSGILNFGIFPGVAARFFICFAGWPPTFPLLGFEVSTFAVTMIALLSIALYFTWTGGQITVIITDFFQGLFILIAGVVITAYAVTVIDWSQLTEVLLAPEGHQAMVHPFHGKEIKNFDFWYFLIGLVGSFYA